MGYYYKVQKLSNVDEVDFEGCYRQFLPHASRNKYEEMVSNKPHLDLPPEEELTSQSDTSKAQKKALKKHSSKALNNLYTKSKVEREGSEEKNAKLILQWPRGQVKRIFEELIKLYQRTDTGDKIQLNKDLKNIKLVSALAHTKELFEQIFGVIQKCHYKTICPTPDNLYAALQEALPAYLLIPITTTLNELHEKNAPQYVIWEKLEQTATNLYNAVVIMQGGGGASANEMSLFGAEMMVGELRTDTRDKWTSNATCYWCQEKGHKAYQCPKRAAVHPKIPRETNNGSNNGINSISGNGNNGNSHRRQCECKCNICGGRHKDENCWEDDKNASRRPPDWKSRLKNNDVQGANMDFDFCL
eukprot:jgi/Psemu1/16554/gm1.16554_g